MTLRRGMYGFSFIELIASLAIMGVLLLVSVPVAQITMKRRQESEFRWALAEIRSGIDRYKRAADAGRIAVEMGASGYPPDLQVLVDGVEDIASPTRKRLYFLRRIPADPFYQGKVDDPSQTWGLRSYESPPDDPQEGKDVFDVYSRSNEQGLNEVPYAQW